MLDIKKLIGKWKLIGEEDIEMHFKENGDLDYIISENGKIQTIKLIYWIEGNIIFTDQPSNSRIERTKAEFKNDELILKYEDEIHKYKKIAE